MDALLLRVGISKCLGDDSTTNHFAKMPKVLTVAARGSFKTVLREYKKSSASGSDDRAHLQRWIDDDRAEQVWDEIQCAVRNNNLWLPPKTFIRDILAARPVAIAIAHRRKLREHYRTAAKQMERVAKFLRKPHPYGMPGYPQSTKLARMLDDAASYFRKEVEPSRNVPGVLKFSHKAEPHMIFMSMVSNDLKGETGRWLDEEVAVLAEIAFDWPDVIDLEAVRWARRQRPVGKKSRP
jgi:hypothetical protein